MAPLMTPISANKSTAETAANNLWEYQLRKENKAILEQVRKIGEKRDADVSENMRRMQEGEKRRLVLEARVAELERDHKDYDARMAEHKKECAAKLAEMENFLKDRTTVGKLCSLTAAASSMLMACRSRRAPQDHVWWSLCEQVHT